VLAGHTLADDLGVFVDEHKWARLVGVGEATVGSCHERRGLLHHAPGKSRAKHFLLFDEI